MKTKQELLEELELKEVNRFTSLSLAEMRDEVSDWFCLEDEADIARIKTQTREQLINRYMNSYMEFKNSYSPDELLSVINN